MLLNILMYAIPAGAIVMVGVAYWSGFRSSDAKRRRTWDEFRETDAESGRGGRGGRPARRLSSSGLAIVPLVLVAGVAVLIGFGMLLWSNALMFAWWRVPLTFVLVLAAIAAWAVGRRFDPSNGRLRCPRCWYDYSALGGSDRCPECGNEPRSLADLRRTRHSRALVVAAPLLLVGAWMSHTLPVVARTSWRSFIPTDVLLWGFDGLPDTLIVGNHEAGSLVERYRSGRMTLGQFDAVTERGTRVLAFSSDVEQFRRACELADYADWSLAGEVAENVPRVIAAAMRDRGAGGTLPSDRLCMILRGIAAWSREERARWRHETEASELVGVVVAAPLDPSCGVIVMGLALMPPERDEVFAPLAAAAMDAARTEEERVASAVQLGLVVGSLRAVHQRDASGVMALDAAEPLVRCAAEIASQGTAFSVIDDVDDYDPEAMSRRGLVGAAREALKAGDPVRARAAMLVLRRAIAQHMIMAPDVQRISELDGAAKAYPELRGEAMEVAAELGLWAAGFDEVIKEGLASAELSRRNEVLSFIVQTPDGRERYEGMIEKLKAEAEADPARADEARRLRKVLFPGAHE